MVQIETVHIGKAQEATSQLSTHSRVGPLGPGGLKGHLYLLNEVLRAARVALSLLRPSALSVSTTALTLHPKNT